MPQYGLKDNVIEKINCIFSCFPEVDEAVLYGSRAKGNYRPGSDIDLALKGDKLEHNILIRILLKIDELMLPYFVELFIYNNINNPDLIEHIERVGVTLYKKNGL